MLARYAEHLPLIDGAVEAVERLARAFRLAARLVIEPAAHRRGARDVRARAALRGDRLVRGGRARRSRRRTSSSRRRVDSASPPERCAAIEDSANGIRAAHAAGMRVVAIPNRRYPPPDEALALADVVLGSIAELDVTGLE